jgi:cysteine desulfuration protein SufE
VDLPPALQEIVDLFDSLPEEERRENLIVYADQAALHEPRPGEHFDLTDERKDEECTDQVGVYVALDADLHARFRVKLGPHVQTLTRAMTAILCRGLDGCTLEEVREIPQDFVPRIVGGQLVRVRSQTVYYVLGRMKGACQALMNRARATRSSGT